MVRLALEKVRGEKLVAKAIRDGMSAVEAFKLSGSCSSTPPAPPFAVVVR